MCIACMSGELPRSIGLQMHCQLLDSEADVPWVKGSVICRLNHADLESCVLTMLRRDFDALTDSL